MKFIGTNYDKSLSTKDIATNVRKYIKEKYPNRKFSIRTTYNTFALNYVEGPQPFITKEELRNNNDIYREIYSPYGTWTRSPEEVEEYYKHLEQRFYGEDISYNLNHYHIKDNNKLNKNTKEMFEDLIEYIFSFRFDDSDITIDYFNTNFYLTVSIGNYNKRFKVVGE